MDKIYNHKEWEEKIYNLWEKSGSFTPKIVKGKKPYTVIMPPPNANDNLHIGHARFVTIEDVAIRYHRMKGVPTLWLPGADHAGIETQFVFEKKLKEKGKSRFDYDRDTLYKMIWDYVQDNKHIMEEQLRRLGASCDWTRNKFTLDPKIVSLVYQTFKNLYDDGLIYRGERIVNYCPRCGTAFSQLEVNSVEQDDELYYLDYQTITIATTRPETIFADTAVAVNPSDNKYKHLIGKEATVPLIDKKIPVISDPLVEKDFGTGALKITPGHDATDFEVGKKHSLAVVSVIDSSGRMINVPEKYLGMKVAAARAEVVKDLKEQGFLKKIEKIHHVVGTCYRDKGLLEPTISKQWFITVESLAKKSLTAIKSGQIKFTAKKFEKIAIHWLNNLNDWNISRQIVWGMRIPAWICKDCGEWTITDGKMPKKCMSCQSTDLKQDDDTFDTWFSSGQWPFVTLKTTSPSDFDYFYPTSLMETAYDILPFWVLRMIMLGLYATKEVPFKEVLIHGLVRDKEGQKISKSKGNVIDPIVMADKYGADALRMGVSWGALIENDICLSEDNIRGQRNFSNKIWNIARFVMNGQIKKKGETNKDDVLILKRLGETIKNVDSAMEKYRFGKASEEIYDFIWHKFADSYLEKSKERRAEAQETLEKVLLSSLIILHPFMPFVTEAIYQTCFAKNKEDLLINASWPEIQ